MIELEKQSPEVFENVDVNFNNTSISITKSKRPFLQSSIW